MAMIQIYIPVTKCREQTLAYEVGAGLKSFLAMLFSHCVLLGPFVGMAWNVIPEPALALLVQSFTTQLFTILVLQ